MIVILQTTALNHHVSRDSNVGTATKHLARVGHLYRHWRLNRCFVRPNPHHRQARCPHCDKGFASGPNLWLHINRNRCAALRQHASQLPPIQPIQRANPPLPHPQLPTELSSMTQQQRIDWIAEFLAINDARVTQNVMQTVWAMASTTELHLPAVHDGSGSRIAEEATAEGAGQQPTTPERSA